jgi:EAL domain-containing protein (putative c-di-GMP-specific phosphodiesterase class I)/GGDEF domain-containing protein
MRWFRQQTAGIRLRLMTKRLLRHWPFGAVVASLYVNFLLFDLVARVAGNAAGALVVLPIAMAAWWYGRRGSIAMSVIATALNWALLAGLADVAPLLAFWQALVAGIIFGLVGLIVGYGQATRRRITTLTWTDEVTGLPNRSALLREVERRERAARGADLAMGMLDLSELSGVSETFGYEVSDDMLAQIARRLAGACGGAFVARNGPDRFTILPSDRLGDGAIAEQLLAALDAPFLIRGSELRVAGRVGVGRRSVVGAGGVGLLRAVNGAVEQANRTERRWSAAEAPNTSYGVGRLDLLSALGKAISGGQLRLHYQPIIDLPSRSVRGFEALVRWQHPDRGLVSPGEFIPLAEQSGLIVPLTEWVLTEAIRQCRTWNAAGVQVGVSINVGAKALTGGSRLPRLTARLLDQYRMDPAKVTLEVTESEMMSDPVSSIAVLRELKALGVRVEIDDFGTGYSSLSYLQQLPIDGVKIDRSFITPLRDDTATAAIVRAAIELSHALGLDAVAEGVEDDALLKLLTSMGCDSAQGFSIARPMAANDVPAWVMSHMPAGAAAPFAREPRPATTGGATGTILVVDDEHSFRLAAHRILSARGYRVINAATASEALRLSTSHVGKIDLLLTDLFLSDWRGNDLAVQIRRSQPALRVLIMSGDPDGAEHAGSDHFIAKPFSRQQLVTGVARALAA